MVDERSFLVTSASPLAPMTSSEKRNMEIWMNIYLLIARWIPEITDIQDLNGLNCNDDSFYLYIFVTCLTCTYSKIYTSCTNETNQYRIDLNEFKNYFTAYKIWYDDILPSSKINQSVQNNPYRHQETNCVTWRPKKRLSERFKDTRIYST